MRTTIAIQGYPASFHDIAARKFFGPELQLISCDTFSEVFNQVSDNEAAYGIVAIENSLYGSINEVYDLLLKHHLHIVGEVYLRIEQCLIGLQGADLKKIKEVHSHPVALAQCETYLDIHLQNAERMEHHDTAASVADIKEWGDPSKAAIASSLAAKLHDMHILAKGIETNSQNYTRFVVLSKNPIQRSTNKTSLVLITDHQPGALHKALGVFASKGVNLSKLQSRPIIGQAWHYMFYVDIDASATIASVQEALKELQSQNCEVIILGSYMAGDKPV